VRAQVALAARSPSRVLLVGPPGSGREHVARTIHYAGGENSPPLTPLAGELLDAELLRTTVTAFLGHAAEQETERPAGLLILEVDQLAADAQAELAGFLNVPELELCVLATARQPLLSLADEGRFREDLAYGLSTLVIELPPLSQRVEDISLLAQLFLEEINAEGKKQLGGFSPEALDLLVAYPWPGNVDELADAVHQAHRNAEGPTVTLAELPKHLHLAAEAAAYPRKEEESIVLDDFLVRVESELIARAMARAKGNKSQAARLLGVSRARLLRRLAQLELDL